MMAQFRACGEMVSRLVRIEEMGFRLSPGPLYPLDTILEDSHSGLVHSLGKREWCNATGGSNPLSSAQ